MNGRPALESHVQPDMPGIAAIPLSLRQQLQGRVNALSYGAFCLLVRQLLYRSGYTSVHAVGRLYRPDALPRSGGARFNPSHGGLDLIALSHTDIATSLTLVQVKQYKGAVPRRFVDEMRGTTARLCAERGLLVTSAWFSPLAREAAGVSHLSPVDLVDGALLIEMLLVRRIGLSSEADPDNASSKLKWLLDAAFFNGLEERVRKMSEDASLKGRKPKPSAP